MAPSLLWFLSAAALLLLTLLGIDTDGLLLMAGLSGLLLTLVTILVPLLPTGLQLVLFAGLVLSGYALLRRWARQQREGPLPQSAAAERAEVISGFDPEGQGRVRWQGQSWAAVNLTPETSLPAGTVVTVMGRDGTRLQVLPRGVSLPQVPDPDRLGTGTDPG